MVALNIPFKKWMVFIKLFTLEEIYSFFQGLEEISLEDRNLQLETLKGDLNSVIEAISQSTAKQKGK